MDNKKLKKRTMVISIILVLLKYFLFQQDSLRKVTHRYPLFLKLNNGKIEKVMKDVYTDKTTPKGWFCRFCKIILVFNLHGSFRSFMAITY